MKFESPTEQLLSAVSLASRFVEKRANLPVLGSILMVAEHGRVILRATNLECGVEVSIPAKVSQEGITAVPGSVLAGFLGNARGKSVTATLAGGTLKVETDRASASIKVVPHEDFPTLPQVSASSSFSAKAGDIARLLRSVAYCASTSAIKPELQSVLLYAEGNKLIAAATDSFRLAEKTVSLRSQGSVPHLLIPARNAVEFNRILEGGSGDVEVYYNEHQISAHVGNVYFTSRLIDGAFPNYRQIIPKEFSTEAVVLREDMSSALKSLSIFADKFAQVSLAIEPSKKSVLLTSRNPDVGEQISTLNATISGEPVAVNFNSKYLADSLQPIAGESVRLHSNGPGKPLLVKDASEDSFFYLAMPMNR
ncbi:MAG TPA: DNA polymerase III subunit beta [Candidatus Paceibacterota bacterium]|nr:DNA polymerase III subunit beta [Candidatus Paceibacterota bacterium]